MFHKLNTEMTFKAEQLFGEEWKKFKKTPVLPELLLSCSVDLLL